MKQLTILIFAFCCFSALGQNSVRKIVAQTTNFYTKVDTNWVEVDSVGYFFREITISEDNSKLTLIMKSGTTAESHAFNIDQINQNNGATVYFCSDELTYTLLVEILDNMVALYYYYDKNTNNYEKAERLIVQSQE